ncbi:hypothetical protein HDU67_005031, partial [Dinochytrium kinnereticum]
MEANPGRDGFQTYYTFAEHSTKASIGDEEALELRYEGSEFLPRDKGRPVILARLPGEVIGNVILFWRTPLEPPAAVKEFNGENPRRHKGMSTGTFSFTGAEIRLKTRDPEQPLCSFETALRISSSRRGKHNKLSWLEFFYED